MQLRPPARDHVGDVQVAQPALGTVGDERPPARHPVLVAQLRLRRERLDDHAAHLARAVAIRAGAHGQLDEPVRGAHQQRRGPPLRVHRPPGHLEDDVAGPHVHARSGQRAARVRSRRLGRQHPHHPPAVVGALEVGAQQPGSSRPVAAAAPRHVRVRRAQLAVDLPQHVDEVVDAAHRVDQRPVPGQLGRPVDPGHVGDPEVVAHQAARLVVHLPPLGGRVDRHHDPPRVDLELVGVALLGRARPRPVRPQHAQGLAVTDDEPGAVAAHGVGAHRVRDHVELAAHQVVALEDGPFRLLVVGPPGAEHALHRPVEPQQAALRRPQPGVAALPDRDRHEPVGQPVDVDHHLGRRVLLLVLRRTSRPEGRSRRPPRTGRRVRGRAGRRPSRRRARWAARPGSPRTGPGCGRPAARGTGATRPGRSGRTSAGRRSGRSCAGTGRRGSGRRW